MTYLKWLCFLSWLILPACAHRISAHRLPFGEHKSTRAVLGSGDVIDVRIFEEKELSGLYQISSEGMIKLPLVGLLKISGLDPEEASKTIAEEYGRKYLRNPEVFVFVQQFNSRKIFLLGEVRSPGSYPYEENMTLIMAVAKAGGVTGLAAANRTLISRNIDGKILKLTAKVSDIGVGDMPDVPIFPGDIIFVPQSMF